MAASKAPVPLLSEGEPVDWFFAFKFNSDTFPGGTVNGKIPKFTDPKKSVVGDKGIFGGTFQAYKTVKDTVGNKVLDKNGLPKKVKIYHGQQYAVASSKNPKLVKSNNECIGTTMKDPLGATFAQIYLTDQYNYLIWNDQFYGDPDDNMGNFGGIIKGKKKWNNPDVPWGHSKGMLAWNDDGDGFVLQVSTPSWPASGSKSFPRKTDGNTLGCINDDDVEVSQHFFCLKINVADLETILKALNNSSVVTDPTDPQIARIGGPANIQQLAKKLKRSSFPNFVPPDPNTELTISDLTTKIAGATVKLISKPSRFNTPPWQLVSAKLGGLPLKVASWWSYPKVYSTNSDSRITCWSPEITEKPGAVDIVETGKWGDKVLQFEGIPQPYGNHAKIGVSTNKGKPYSIFGDMNQVGTLIPWKDPRGKATDKASCNIHQNGRGGLFYVIDNKELFKSITELLTGDVAPLKAPKKKPAAKKTSSKKAAVKKGAAKKVPSKKAAVKKVAVKKTTSKKAAAKKGIAKKTAAKKITTPKKKSNR